MILIFKSVINELNKLQMMPYKSPPDIDLRKMRIESTKNLCSKLDIEVISIYKVESFNKKKIFFQTDWRY